MNKVSYVGRIIQSVVVYVFMTITLAVLVYIVFATFFNTDTERRLISEIQAYERLYPELGPRGEMIGDAIAGLQHKDNDIYELVFHSSAPGVDPMAQAALPGGSADVPDTKLVSYARDKADSLLSVASAVEAAFADVFSVIRDSIDVLPPMLLPIDNIKYPQVGAGVGRRMNPVYKAYVMHEGLDFVVSRGTPVSATGDGTVVRAITTRAEGTVVEISHAGGYRSVYKHMEKGLVHQGQRVKAGQRIGSVGMSRGSYAPHLHYEVRRGGASLDPVGFIFGSVRPENYADFCFMSDNTMQSMD